MRVGFGVPQVRPAALDAFGRARVSNPQTLFDSKQVYDDQALFFVTGTATGGTAVYNQDRASTLLTVTSTSGSKVTRQSRRYFNYQPGKSQLVYATAVFGASDATLRREVGLFDDNDGIFLRQQGDNVQIVQRSKVSGVVVDTVVNQADWNGDKFLGTGLGGVLDLSAAQVIAIDYEWLGTGPSRLGFSTANGIVIAHTFENPNTISSVYMRTPNLPVRYQIERIGAGPGGNATLEEICSTVMSEGGQQQLGAVWAADRDVTGQSVVATHYVPIMSIRLRAGHLRRTVVPLSFQLHQTSNGSSAFRILLNPSRGAGTVPSWTARDASLSSVEYDVASTQVITGGQELGAGYVVNGAIFQIGQLPSQLTLGAQDIAGAVPDELVIAARAVTAGPETVLGSLSWVEL